MSAGPLGGPPPRPPPAVLDSLETGLGMQHQYQYFSGYRGPNLTPSCMNMSCGAINPCNELMFGATNMGHSSPEGAFIRQAEESSRGAFQSIESVVGAVTSIATLLNSTHTAVFSSFRAVIRVVEQFRVLKKQFAAFFLAVIRRISILWKRILTFLRLKPRNYVNSEDVWSGLRASSGPSAGEVAGVNWATLIFWLVALGGPYLIYKSVAEMVKNAEESKKWAIGEGEHYTAQGLFDFVAANNQELSFSANEMLRVAPKHEQLSNVRDWLLASSRDGQRIGLVPMNYIRLINRNITSSPPTHHSSILDSTSSVNDKKDLATLYRSAFSMPNKP